MTLSARLVPSWPWLVALGVALRVTAQRMALLNDPDTYLHIAAGRWMIEHRALPVHDPFSHSMAGAAWVPHEWLSEIVLAVTYDAVGWAGLTVLATAMIALSLGMLTRRLLATFEPLSALILVVISATTLLPHALARPHVLALPLLVLWSAELMDARNADRGPRLRLLPLMALWANLHGSFMAGLALAAYLGAEAVVQAAPGLRLAALRRWGMFGLLSIGAAFLTPNGIAAFVEPIRLSSMPVLQSTFIEWQSPSFKDFQPLGLWLAGGFLGLALGLRLPLSRIVLTIVLIGAALQHQRHEDLVAVIVPLALAASLGPQIASRVRTDPPSSLARRAASLAVPAGAGGMLVALLLLATIGTLSLLDPIARSDDPVTPATALAAARDQGLTGPVFNNEGFGGYLVFSGVPVFIDGRIEMYGDAFLKRYLDAELGREPALDDVLARDKIQWALLTPGSGAASVLDRLPGWHRTYADAVAVVYARN